MMIKTKIIGIIFMIVGAFVIFSGISKTFENEKNKEDRIYTTAEIVRIEVYKSGEDREYRVFVELEVDGEKTTRLLNMYTSSYKEGKQIDVYYFENDLEMVYAEGSDFFSTVLFIFVGAISIVLGKLAYSAQRSPHSKTTKES